MTHRNPSVCNQDAAITQHDDAINVHANAPLLIQIDKGIGKQFLMAMWWSAAISGAAIIGLIATCFFIYATIGHVAVLQYDLFDLRAKTGFAHENTPEPETEEQQ